MDREPLTPAPTYSVHEKQREVLESNARYVVQEWGRRAGKNITSVIGRIEHARAPWESPWGTDDPENGTTWWVGPSYDQAFKYGFQKLRSALPNEWIDGDPKRSEPYEITLTNGWTFEFRTFDHPETLQGAGVDDMLIDEADYMPDDLWYDDLEPMLMDTGGRATFISKPVRPRSYFQILAERGKSSEWPNHFYSHATSADNPFIEDDPMDKRGTMPEHKFRQQYLAELPDDGGQVFTDLSENLFTDDVPVRGELIDGTGEVKVPRDAVDMIEPFTVGADFAQKRDYRVTLVADATGRLVYLRREQNEAWSDVQAHLERMHHEYPGVVVPDATRDNKIIEDLWRSGVNLKPTKFSPQAKVTLIENLITAVEQSEVSAPDDPAFDRLRTEMRMFEKEVTNAGYTKYHAPDSGYDDCVDALALVYEGLDHAGAATATASVGGDDDRDTSGGIEAAAREQARQRQDLYKGWK
jgi:hypothetical protein